MMVGFNLALLFVISVSTSLADEIDYPIPKDFKLGVATAAYQVEGAWNEDGKGPSIWDTYYHERQIDENHSGDIACDSYHKYLEDVQMLKYLGVNHYRFSISWPRILPKGTKEVINQAGIEYYRKLIAAVKENGIIPMVTLYHWDLPQALQDVGGWLNASIVEHYADYARIVFEALGNEVTLWSTFNEPKEVCRSGYGVGVNAPNIVSDGIGDYMCAHNLIKAHARAYHIYDEDFRPEQNGRISIVLNADWIEPRTNSSKLHKEAAERTQEFNVLDRADESEHNLLKKATIRWPRRQDSTLNNTVQNPGSMPAKSSESQSSECLLIMEGVEEQTSSLTKILNTIPELGLYANPIYHRDGNYPQVMIDRIGNRSRLEGYEVSRLPPFTDEEVEYIKGTSDFFSLNTYSASYASYTQDPPIGTTSFDNDLGVYVAGINLNVNGIGWGIVPWGIRKLLNWIYEHYDQPEIVITENGYADKTGQLDDQARVDYFKDYIGNVMLALHEDKVNITGYTAWSLMDNLEWNSGFSVKFGLYHVDFESPERTRTIKKSGEYYKKIIETRCLIEVCREV